MTQGELLTISKELVEAERNVQLALIEGWLGIGRAFAAIKDDDLWHQDNGGTHTTWQAYCMETWRREARSIDRSIDAYKFVSHFSRVREFPQDKLPSAESQALTLAKLEEPERAADVWMRILENANGSRITNKIVQIAVNEELEPAPEKDFWLVDEWKQLVEAEREAVLTAEYESSSKFNKQKSASIEWAQYSWNPVTGCLHDCLYCYARDIALGKNGYIQGFDPALVPNRLDAPSRMPHPNSDKFDRPVDKIGHSNVFVCSMADLFGKWVPTEWIEAVLERVQDNPQWNFLFLTKFPIRMSEFDYPANAWLGTTVDRPEMTARAETAFEKLRMGGYEGIAWLSCEPLLGPVKFDAIHLFDWLVIGGQSKSTRTPALEPDYEWHVGLFNQADQANIPVYHKTNIGFTNRLREYPTKWGIS